MLETASASSSAPAPASSRAPAADAPPLTPVQAVALGRAQVDHPEWPAAHLAAALVAAYRRSGLSAEDYTDALGSPRVTAADLAAYALGCDPRTGDTWPELVLASARLRVGQPVRRVVGPKAEPAPATVAAAAATPPPLQATVEPAGLPAGARGRVVEWLGGETPPRLLPRERALEVVRAISRLGTPAAFADAARAAGVGHPKGDAIGVRIAHMKARSLLALYGGEATKAGADARAWGLADLRKRWAKARKPAPPAAPAPTQAPTPKPRPAALGAQVLVEPAVQVVLQHAALEGPGDGGEIVARLVLRPGDPYYREAACALRARLTSAA